MNVVMIIPTGIGCEIGGHAGDATPAARLLASVCDKLIIHPNAVNASDINEMPRNALYVEGSALDRFLCGEICLKEVKSNRILVAATSPLRPEVENAVSAARATLGVDATIMVMKENLSMTGWIEDGVATGSFDGVEELCDQVCDYGWGNFDVLAVSSPISVDEETKLNYFRNGGVSPWGRIEALVSKEIAKRVGMPIAHAPVDIDILDPFNEVVDPRQSAEMVSIAYLFCVLKGLHKAPRYEAPGMTVSEVDALVSPLGCWGAPHIACAERNIPIIAVKENITVLEEPMPGAIFVANYLEAAGMLAAMRAGISCQSIRRPLCKTRVVF